MSSYVAYLTSNDYSAVIQSGQLNEQLLDALKQGLVERKIAEAWAIGQMRSKLKQKYDLDYELTPTLPYNPTKVYLGGDRVIIDYDNYVTGNTYKQYDCVINPDDSIGYMCTVEQSQNVWDESEWQSLGDQYTIYHIPLPFPRFSIEVEEAQGVTTKGFYQVGDNVWWADHTYEALRQTVTLDHSTEIQYYTTSDLPLVNTFPNDKSQGALWWKDLGLYSIDSFSNGNGAAFPIGTEDAPSAWLAEDNRDEITIQVLVDLSLWMLHKRISPMNIPVLRESAKNDAFGWLTNVKNADINTDLEPLQPAQGESFRWGSDTKKINQW